MTTGEVIAIANIATPVVCGVFGFLVRQAIGRLTDRIERLEGDRRTDTATIAAHDRAIVDVAARLHNEIDELEKGTVRREDYIRESARTRLTLERMVENQARMEGKLDIGHRVATGIERLADQRHGTDEG